jgi:plastocyanin
MKSSRLFIILSALALLGITLAAPASAVVSAQPSVSLFLPLIDSSSRAVGAQSTTVDVQVGVNMLSFSPQQVTIHVGDTVRWTWVSDSHTVTSGSPPGTADGKFCSPNDQNCSAPVVSKTGFVYQHTFTQAGTFPYFCAIHFGSGMTGTVVVTP